MVPPMPRTARMRGTKATSTLKAMAPAMKKMRSSAAFSTMRRPKRMPERRAGMRRGPAGGAAGRRAAGFSTAGWAAGGSSAEGRLSSAMWAKVPALRARGQARNRPPARGSGGQEDDGPGGAYRAQGRSGAGARLLRDVDPAGDVLLPAPRRARLRRALAAPGGLADLPDPALHGCPGLASRTAAGLDGMAGDFEAVIDLVAHVIHRVDHGLADLAEAVLGAPAEPERALADAGAGLGAGARGPGGRDAGAEQGPEEEGGDAAGAALHHDLGEIVVIGHDSSFAGCGPSWSGRPVRARRGQRAAAGSAT